MDFNYEGGFDANELVTVIEDLKKARKEFEISMSPGPGLWGTGSLKPDTSLPYASCPTPDEQGKVPFVAGLYHTVFSQAHDSIDFINMQYYAGWEPIEASKVKDWMICGGPVGYWGGVSKHWAVGLEGDLRAEFLSKLVVGFQGALPDSTSEYLQEYETMPVAGFMVYDAEQDSPGYILTKALLATPPGSKSGGE